MAFSGAIAAGPGAGLTAWAGATYPGGGDWARARLLPRTAAVNNPSNPCLMRFPFFGTARQTCCDALSEAESFARRQESDLVDLEGLSVAEEKRMRNGEGFAESSDYSVS
jgi:hypothetical protein